MKQLSNQNISKSISYFLRHKPMEIGLELDKYGKCKFTDLVEKVNNHLKISLTIDDYIAIFDSEKNKRYEFSKEENYIRAFYGHSFPVEKEITDDLPDVLYHGTSRDAYSLILEKGIKKMSRNKVHLSETKEMALRVGSRRDKEPIILNIDTKLAIKEGVVFHKEPNGVYLCDYIPINCIY